MNIGLKQVADDVRRVPTPYPALTLVAGAALAGALIALLVIFGDGLKGSADGPGDVFVAYTALLIVLWVTPLFGVKALFGDYVPSLVALTFAGVVFLMGSALTVVAVFPAAVILAVSAFTWWKWSTQTRRVT